nr:hypothetical protein [Streptomyces sp. S1D4-11]
MELVLSLQHPADGRLPVLRRFQHVSLVIEFNHHKEVHSLK